VVILDSLEVGSKSLILDIVVVGNLLLEFVLSSPLSFGGGAELPRVTRLLNMKEL
jgi:hypothetical protein